MEIIINDTNVFLDLYDVGLLETFFQLPVTVHTIDLVVNEIIRPAEQKAIQALIGTGQLSVKDYPAQHLNALSTFNAA